MALTNFGFIVRGDGFDPESDVQVMETPSFGMTTIGVARRSTDRAMRCLRTDLDG